MKINSYTIKLAKRLKAALENNNATTAQFCGINASEFMADEAHVTKLLEEYALVEIAQDGRAQQIKNGQLKMGNSAQSVVRGILCDPQYGPNSPLYVEAGYIAHNQRKSGLRRGTTSNEPAAPTGQAPGAAPSGQAPTGV